MHGGALGRPQHRKKISIKTIIFVFESIVQCQIISSSNLEIPGFAFGCITLGRFRSFPLHRPELNSRLSAVEFRSWYWLKSELLTFCRSEGVNATGSKPYLADRIAAHLDGAALHIPTQPPRNGTMPNEFTLETVVGEGWRCNRALGEFLRSQCGSGFRFNAIVRNLIHTQPGVTLADVVNSYLAGATSGRLAADIPVQLEYNRHTREFYANNPGASRQQVIEAWWARRSRRAA